MGEFFSTLVINYSKYVMDKKAYMTPDMEVVKMNYNTVLLSGSDGSTTGTVVPKEDDDDPIEF